jgi:hypothetical protein
MLRFLCLIFVIVLSACESGNKVQNIDKSLFETQKYNSFLAFDFRDKNKPKAGIILSNRILKGHYSLNIPFKTTAFNGDKNLLLTQGINNNYSLLNFDINSKQPEYMAISFTPNMTSSSYEDIATGGFKEKIYFITNGLERYFVYNYNTLDYEKKLNNSQRAKYAINLDVIALVLPVDAKGIEIRDQKISIPNYIHKENNVYFYPYSIPSSGEQQLEIKYQLKETTFQHLYGIILTKLIIVLIPSLLALALIPGKEILNPKARKLGTIFFGALTAFCILGMLVYSYFYQDDLAINSWIDIVIVVIAAIAAIIVFYIKKPLTSNS